MTLGSEGRVAGIVDDGKRQMFGSAWDRGALRGESSAFRRSGTHKRRCTAWRGGGSRATRDLRNDRGRPPVLSYSPSSTTVRTIISRPLGVKGAFLCVSIRSSA